MHRRLSLVVLLVMMASLVPVSVSTVSAALGFVGNMFPAGGSSSSIGAGGSFTVYIQAYKGGVTEAPGQGGGIGCNLVWSEVSSFGGTWLATTTTPMVFNGQVGNNDEYRATITPGIGRYEFTAHCTDSSDNSTTWQNNGNGRLSVNNTGQCLNTQVGDNNVFYSGLFHDSFSTQYRSPLGPVPSSQGTVTLRFRTCQNDVSSVTARIWNDRSNSETAALALTAESNSFDATLNAYVTVWKVELPIPAQPTILYYTFRASDGTASGYYRDDDPKFLGGGFGQAEANQSVAYDNSYQISVFDPGFTTPEWMQRAVIYQIFPDRFRDGNTANNPAAGRFSYDRAGGAIVRSNDPEGDWNSAICDPRGQQGQGFNCADYYGDNFYGGDLAGITQKIEDGYFSSLGVTLLYLNPIFRAPSNHKYDTANFMEIDPDFGTLAEFQALVAAANARGIRIMLDGVFNHTSSDSPYFDRYGRYASNGTLNDVDGGTLDGTGACEAVSAQYRGWFYFEGDPGTTIFNPGGDGGTIVRCADSSGNFTLAYEAWYGYSSLPKIRSGLPTVRDYFYGSASAVGPYWTQQGASGWRFDVGADVDPGLTNDPANDYWEGFRAAVRNPALSGKADTVMLGEEWGDGSPWLLGGEWDSLMNYRFRSAVLGWMFTGCAQPDTGCAGGTKFQENDSNDNSSSGSIFYLSPSQFNARLRSIHEDYPANAFKAMMNLEGSHDTQRVRFLLKKINNGSDAAAVQRMKEWWLFAFTYAGAPTLYYGDEVGLSHDGVVGGGTYQDDPYNRAPFPWPDASGSAYMPDTGNLQAFARHMASIRHSYRALQDGDVRHGLVINDAEQLYGFARTNGAQTALVLLNRSGVSRSATFSGLNAAPYNLADGTLLLDAISGATYTVAGGSANVNVTSTWGAVLLEQAKIETPAAAAPSASAQGADVALTWPMVTGDSAGGLEVVTSYTLHRGASAGFTPSAANQIASLTNPAFGGNPGYTDAGAASGGHFYVVRACNAAGSCSSSQAVPIAAQATALSAGQASGTYAGSVDLTATLSAGATPLAGRTVTFSLNGASVGSATTNTSGVATLTGVGLSGIDAGSYPTGVAASFAGNGAYNAASGSAALTVGQAATTTTVSCPSSVPYTGAAQEPCIASVTGPGGLSDNVVVAYAGNSAAGTASASADYPGSTNYLPSSSSTTFEIGAVGSTTTLSCPASVSFTGAPQEPCSATVTGAGGLSEVVAITYADNTVAGTATATATYAGDANHAGSSSSTTFVISKAATTTTVSCPPGPYTYDGAAKTPCSAIVTGPGGLSQAPGVSYSNNTNAGTATASASYPGDTNYEASSGSATFAIEKATTTTTVTCPGAPVTATGAALTPCSAIVTGPGSLSQALTVTYANNVNPGTATASASYPGDANYDASSNSATFTIASPTTTYSFTGFFAPVDNPPVVNVAKAGSAIPVKFSLGGNYGLSIFQSAPSVATLACPVSAPTDAIESTVSASANSLSYDAVTGRYTFVWKTEKGFAGSCRQLVLRFNDGTTKTATFNFTR